MLARMLFCMVLLHSVTSCSEPDPFVLLDMRSSSHPCWDNICVGDAERTDALTSLLSLGEVQEHYDYVDPYDDSSRISVFYSSSMERIYGFRRITAYFPDEDIQTITAIAVGDWENLTFKEVVESLGEPEYVVAKYAPSPGYDLLVGLLYPVNGIAVWSQRIQWSSKQNTYAVRSKWRVSAILLFSTSEYDITGYRNDKASEYIQPWSGWNVPSEILDISPLE